MTARKEVEHLLTCAKACGAAVRLSRSGHWKVFLGGRLVTVIPGTASDHRSLLNARAALRRAGVSVP